MRMLIDGLPAQVSENVGQDPNHKTGPFYWTNAYAGARACMEAVSTYICLLSDWGQLSTCGMKTNNAWEAERM